MSNLGNKQIMAKNIQKFMDLNGKTRNDMCEALGVKYTTFTDWVKGNSYPRIDKIELMANYFGINKSDLVEDKDKVIPFDTLEIPPQHLLPVVGRVCAGNGTFAEQDIITYMPADAKFSKDEHFFLKVVGDSMSPVVQEGDLVLVRKQRSVDSGSMAVVVVNEEEGMIKKVEYTDDTITLSSFNPYYPPRVFTGADVQNVYVVGLVVKSERYY